ncbi:MAG: hypothetical protein HKN31_12020, partial [Pricia sp.]|nr:hypothetical protein [Pricia sp.]
AQHVIEALDDRIHVVQVILDYGENRKKIFARRIRRIGLIAFFGQLMFRFIIVPYLRLSSKDRKEELYKTYARNRSQQPFPPVRHVDNINSAEGNQFLNSLDPTVVVVVSRRIISKRTLNRVKAKFINIHDGIVPRYRGLFGAYWAMVENDMENCGATVHFIDENLDTGTIIAQTNIRTRLTKEDNFFTYPLHQFASALPLLNQALLDIGNGRLSTQKTVLEVGKVRFVPTLWTYIMNMVRKGIK